MNGLTIDECFAALKHEREVSADLRAEVAKMEERNKRLHQRNINVEQKNRWLITKMERMQPVEQESYSFFNSDECVIFTEVSNYVAGREDAGEISIIMGKLLPIGQFWRSVKHQPISSIVTILQEMKTQKGFDAVVAVFNNKPKLQEVKKCS